MELNEILDRLNLLCDEGGNVLATKYHPGESSKAVILSPYKVNNAKFSKWQSKCIPFLESFLNSDDYRLINFKEKVKINNYLDAQKGMAILESLIDDINENNFSLNHNDVIKENSHEIIENIFNKFHRVARQLRIRHSDRQTIDINDEYDVQDLLHALLLINFDDLRPEEWTPSYAGSSNRMDFLIKDVNTVIETKMTRETLKDKQIGEQLIIDIANYSIHPDCGMLYCFVYDKGEYIKNPVALENDLSGMKDGLEVKVIIVPKF